MNRLKYLHKYIAMGYLRDGAISIDDIIDTTNMHERYPRVTFGEVLYYDEEDYNDGFIDEGQIGSWATWIDEPVRKKEARKIILEVLEAWMRIT